jgi:hypothetical protein
MLRQDDNQSFFMITCAYFMLIFTSRYENIITSQLIVPDQVQRYRTISELTDDGFKIVLLCDDEIRFNRKLPDSMNQTIAEHFTENGKTLDEFYQSVKFEFQEASSNSFLMDVGNVSLKYAVLQQNYKKSLSSLEAVLSRLHQKPCFKVKDSISSNLQFMFFNNFLVYEQLHIALLMRDHGLIAWFYQLQEYSESVPHSPTGKRKTRSRRSTVVHF